MAIYSTRTDSLLLGKHGYLDTKIADKVMNIIVYNKSQHTNNMVRVLKPHIRNMREFDKAETLLGLPVGAFNPLVEQAALWATTTTTTTTTPTTPTTPPLVVVSPGAKVRLLQKWHNGVFKTLFEISAERMNEVEEWVKKSADFDPGRADWKFELFTGKLVKKITL